MRHICSVLGPTVLAKTWLEGAGGGGINVITAFLKQPRRQSHFLPRITLLKEIPPFTDFQDLLVLRKSYAQQQKKAPLTLALIKRFSSWGIREPESTFQVTHFTITSDASLFTN